MTMQQSHHQQRGAALLLAMIIVTLIATLAVSMVWQQWRAVQVETAERARAQSAWILSGALDWAGLILKEDARPSAAPVDHLGEPWAVPLAEARLSTFLAADTDNTDDAPEAFLSGSITDAQSHFNLRNLIDAKGEVSPLDLAILRRLCENVNVTATTADLLAKGLKAAYATAGRRVHPPTRRSCPSAFPSSYGLASMRKPCNASSRTSCSCPKAPKSTSTRPRAKSSRPPFRGSTSATRSAWSSTASARHFSNS